VTGASWTLLRNRACDPTPVNGYTTIVLQFQGVPALSAIERNEINDGFGDTYTQSQLRDFNGDGNLDLFNDGQFFLGTKTGFEPEGPQSQLTSTWAAIHPDVWDRKRIALTTKEGTYSALTDLNGDRRPDFVLTDMNESFFKCISEPENGCNPPAINYCTSIHGPAASGTWLVWPNTGNGFRTTPISWSATGWLDGRGCNSLQPRRVLDLDGNGVTDQVRLGLNNTWYMHANAAEVPDLLRKVRNGIGGESTFEYRGVVGATASGNLHFPVQVVSRTVSLSGLSSSASGVQASYVSNFDYEGVFYDRARRIFRGFGRAIADATDDLGGSHHEEHIFAVGDSNRSVPVPSLGLGCSELFFDDPALAGLEFGLQTGPGAGQTFQESWMQWTAFVPTGVPAGVTSPRMTTHREIVSNGSGGQRRRRTRMSAYDVTSMSWQPVQM